MIIVITYLQQMPDCLQAFDLFPFFNFWRLRGKSQATNNCGGIISICILIAVFALLIERVVTVFKMSTMTATSETVISEFPPKTTVSTYQHLQNQQPFMFGFEISDILSLVDPNLLRIIPYYSIAKGNLPNREADYQLIYLDKCSAQHFSQFPNIQNLFPSWTANTWFCLPLNKTFDIQGSWNLNGVYSSINVLFNCSGACMSSFNGLNIQMYTLSSTVNPTNSTSSEQLYIEEINLPITPNVHQQFSYELTENVIKTDSSLFPWKKQSTTRSLRTESFRSNYKTYNMNYSSTLVYFQRSVKTIIYERSYLRLLDAFSYVGGNFQAIIGLFFFMGLVGKLFFQLNFAKHYFKNKFVQDFGGLGCIKLIVYKILTAINCPPEWINTEERAKIRTTVGNLLDITYLQKRINFLEKALSVLLEKHQFEALFLCQNITREEADETYEKYNLKERLIYYLSQRDRGKKMGEFIEQTNKKILWEGSATAFMDEKGLEELKAYRQIRSGSENQQVLQKSREKKRVKEPFSLNSILEEQIMNKEEKERQQRKRIQEVEQKIKGLIENLTQVQFEGKEEEIEMWIKRDFKTLVEQAESQDGDKRSKLIYNELEGWLKHMLQAIIEEKDINKQSNFSNKLEEIRE